ncbi:MAG TPA: PH domain-containing protein [Candidatus Binatia bacterium]|nr:PH domain-containing protein [Candidatus Binatia bacterium]
MQPTNPIQPPSEDDDLLGHDEQVLVVIHQHWAGAAEIYGLAIFSLLSLVILGFFVIPGLNLSAQTAALATSLAIFVIGLFLAVLMAAIYIYHKSSLTLTDRSIVQLVQRTLFNRKFSRLSMSNVEDVNCEQKGVIANMLGYGTLTVQTAGEEDNFVFKFCPTPNIYAERILAARQAYTTHKDDKDPSSQTT